MVGSTNQAARVIPSSVSMTLNRYSHVTTDMQREAADKMDAFMAGCF
jgi:hypothetical protein